MKERAAADSTAKHDGRSRADARSGRARGERTPGRAGRPSREEAGQLQIRILDAATELLLTEGYGDTSIEAVARRARVSKRTFYHRFSDKPALTRAVVSHLIDGLRPPPEVPLIEGQSLEEILTRLASLILHAALSPRLLQLQRLIVAESERFPELAAAVAKAGGRQEAVALIGGVLRRHGRGAGAAAISEAEAAFAAEQFLQMVVSVPQLRALGLGKPLARAELDAWGRNTVGLFLDGFRGRR
ncbi:MAG: TetR family transcriptional regulator [Burkholderiaceae bacterium]|nr:TetR family transcriptional regulator [Burkholderiaceae bacterium]